MRPICEVVVKEVLPAMRSILAEEMVDSGLKQEEVAEKLYLTQSGVSRYLKRTRGKNIQTLKDNKHISKILKEAAKEISEKPQTTEDITLKFCDICKEIRKQGLLCHFHKVSDTCNICMEKNIFEVKK